MGGGFILFLAFAFLMKYFIENNLISPLMRICLGMSAGILILLSGLLIQKEQFKTTADTLCGVGLTVLYGSVFCAYELYQILSVTEAFALMALVSGLAFVVSVWKRAKYIGFLAEVISIVTPFLLTPREINISFFLFYITAINAVAATVALFRKWPDLLLGSVGVTFLCQLLILVQPGICEQSFTFGFFSILFCLGAAFIIVSRQTQLSTNVRNTLAGFIAGNILFDLLGIMLPLQNYINACAFLAVGFLLNMVLVYLTCKDEKISLIWWRMGQCLLFVSLLVWSIAFQMQIGAVVLLLNFLLFAAINEGAEVFLYKRQEREISWWPVLFPLVLMLPLRMFFANLSAGCFTVVSLLLILLFCFSAGFSLVEKRPSRLLISIGVFGILLLFLRPGPFWSVSWEIVLFGLSLAPVILLIIASRRFFSADSCSQTAVAVFVAALMPYLLLLSAVGRMKENIALFLGFTLALNILSWVVAYIYRNGKLLPVALIGSILIQIASSFVNTGNDTAAILITGFIALNGIFVLIPLIAKQRFIEDRFAWITVSFAGLAAFFLLLPICGRYYEIEDCSFAVIFELFYGALLYWVYGWQPLEQGIQRMRISCLGGVTLFFTLAFFPIYFEIQKWTVAFALEGLALAWLNKKLHYIGLLRVAFGLLIAAFFGILGGTSFAVEENMSLLNRFLYVFGIVGAAMFYVARQFSREGDNRRANWLNILGGLLFFALLNIEIAVYFTLQSGLLRFDVFGSFNAAIVYTLGWTVFGCVCLFVGYGKKNSFAKPIGLTLIGISLLKLFLSDIWALGGLYRIVGLIGIALVLIAVSFLFQMLRKR